MADIFGVSRARVREVLARLAHEQIVELFPQRGAYVAKPTIEQARDIFEARRLIEPAVLRRLVDTLTPEKITRLRQHEELEADARRRNDKRAVIRLSGEFHTLAAELAGNSALSRSMRELCMLTCLRPGSELPVILHGRASGRKSVARRLRRLNGTGSTWHVEG